jgi:ribosomal protein L30/L7E
MQHEVELPDSPTVRGMIFKVRHLVRVIEPASGAGGAHETA